MANQIRIDQAQLRGIRLRAQLLRPAAGSAGSGLHTVAAGVSEAAGPFRGGAGDPGVAAVATAGETLLAAQGQDWNAVRFALSLRAGDATQAQVNAAFDSGRLVRSWPMRGTLHVVPARDIGWVLRLLSAPVLAGAEKRRAAIGLELTRIEGLRAHAETVLAGGGALSRDELFLSAERSGLSFAGPQRYHAIWYLAQTGTLVFGPVRGDEQLLVLAQEWIGAPRELDDVEGMRELAWRYLCGHGAATARDLAWWAKCGLTRARRAIESNADRLTAVEADGTGYAVPTALLADGGLRAQTDEGSGPAAEPLLLPGFDEYFLGYQDRDPVVDPEFAARIVPGNNGVFRPILVVAGRVAGTWARRVGAGAVTVTVEPFAPLATATREGLAASAARYGDYLGLPVRCEVV